MINFNLPALGAGVGLRPEHFEEILTQRPACRWFEIIAENFMGFGGYVEEVFAEIRKQYTIIPHGVCMSIGSTDPLDMKSLKDLKLFLDQIKAPWMSDHLCFTMIDHTNLNELIPIPFSEESLQNVISRVKIVQDVLERPFLLENVTRYLTVSDREMDEAEFIGRLLAEADCGLLLDITNVHLNSLYHSYDALDFINSLPLERIGQIHLAGWEEEQDCLIDSHDAPVPAVVWELYKHVIDKIGRTSVLIEWDANLPPFERLLKEAEMAESYFTQVESYREAV